MHDVEGSLVRDLDSSDLARFDVRSLHMNRDRAPPQRQRQRYGADRRKRHGGKGAEAPGPAVDRPDDAAAAMVAAVGDGAKRAIVGKIGVVDLVAKYRGDARINQAE